MSNNNVKDLVDNKANNDEKNDEKKAKRVSVDFNEVTTIARTNFEKSLAALEVLKANNIVVPETDAAQLKYTAIKNAIDSYGKKKYRLNSYIIDFHHRVDILVKNSFFREWCELVGALVVDKDGKTKVDKVSDVAQHVVFLGQTELVKVLTLNFFTKDKLEIPFHKEWEKPIFKDKLDGQLVKPAEKPEGNGQAAD